MDKQTHGQSPESKPTVIYICSPYRPMHKTEAERRSELEANIERAKAACRMVSNLGYMPLAAHIYFTQFLNDRDPAECEKGMALGLQWLEKSDELWIFGRTISDGMAVEINRAKELGKPVRCIYEPGRGVEMLLREIMENKPNAVKGNEAKPDLAKDNVTMKSESEEKNNG